MASPGGNGQWRGGLPAHMPRRKIAFPADLFGDPGRGIEGFGSEGSHAREKGAGKPADPPGPPPEARRQMEELSRLLGEFGAERGSGFGRRRGRGA